MLAGAALRALRDERVRAHAAHGASEALAGRELPRLVLPGLNDPRYGSYEGDALARLPCLGRRRLLGRGRARGRRESLHDHRPLRAGVPGAARPTRATRSSSSPTRCRSRYALSASRERLRALSLSSSCAYATPYRLRPRLARARGRRRRGLARRARLVSCDAARRAATLGPGPARPHRRAHPSPAADRAGRRVLCLVSGGADSTCLCFALRELGYRASALHVNHRLRGEESEGRRALLRARSSAPRSSSRSRSARERGRAARAPLRRAARRAAGDRAYGERPGRDDPLPPREQRQHQGDQGAARGRRRASAALGLARRDRCVLSRARVSYRVDSSNPETVRGLIRGAVIPLLEQIHPGARENILRSLEERGRFRRRSPSSSPRRPDRRRVDLGGGVQAVREHDRLWLESGPVELEGRGRVGRLAHPLDACPGLRVRGWQAGDRLAGRTRKIQDVFVDAKIPRSDREGWPLVVRGGEVVAVPGSSRPTGWRRCGCEPDAELEAGVSEVLIDEPRLQGRVRELGAEIRRDYAARELLLVGVLKGAVFFMADLMRAISVPCEIDFMAISSYGASTRLLRRRPYSQGPRHQHRGPPRARRRGHHRLGAHLSYLVRNSSRGAGEPRGLRVSPSPGRREIDVEVRYVGFEIPNRFVVGYGLDFAERYRNLPYVGRARRRALRRRVTAVLRERQRKDASSEKIPSGTLSEDFS